MELGNLLVVLWVALDDRSGKLRYPWVEKLLSSNAAFKLADAALIFVYPLPVKSECWTDRIDGDAGGEGESNEIIASLYQLRWICVSNRCFVTDATEDNVESSKKKFVGQQNRNILDFR